MNKLDCTFSVILVFLAFCSASGRDCDKATQLIEQSRNNERKEKSLLIKAVSLCDTSEYAYWRLYELEEEKISEQISDPKIKYTSSKSTKAISYLDKVLELNPSNLKAEFLRIQFDYANGELDTAKAELSTFIANIEDSETKEECIQQIQRIEWLQTLPENSIDQHVLYTDRGRPNDSWTDIGSMAGQLGNSLTQATGNLIPAGGGLVVSGAMGMIGNARESTDFVQKLYEKQELNDLAEKCLNQLPRRINNTGFNSLQTALMLSGSTLGMPETDPAKIHHYRQLARIANQELTFSKEQVILEAILKANVYLLKNDSEASKFQKLEYCKGAIDICTTLQKEYGLTKVQEENFEWLKANIQVIEDSVFPPTEKQLAKRAKEVHLNELLADRKSNLTRINAGDVSAKSLWRIAEISEVLNDYMTAADYYALLEPYYINKPDSLSKIRAHKITCNFLSKKIHDNNPSLRLEILQSDSVSTMDSEVAEEVKNTWLRQWLFQLRENENISDNINQLKKINTGLALINRWEKNKSMDKYFEFTFHSKGTMPQSSQESRIKWKMKRLTIGDGGAWKDTQPDKIYRVSPK